MRTAATNTGFPLRNLIFLLSMLTYPSNPIPTTLIKYCPLIIPISIFLFLPLIILSIASFIFNGIFALLAKSFPVPLGITPSGVFDP